MNAEVSKVFRSVQVYFPGLQDYRFTVQRNMRRWLNKPHEEDFRILSLLPKTSNHLFLDIGANRGDAIQSILMQRPDAHIIAFEPNGLLIDKIRKVYGDDPRVQVVHHGLGNTSSSFDLYIPFYNKYMFDGLASFKEENAANWLKTRLYGYQAERLEVKRIACTVRRLDDFFLEPFFIKIDVQGYEYEVLLGGEKTIEACKPTLLIETPGKNEIGFLETFGYKPRIFRNDGLIIGTKSLNVFFMIDEVAESVNAKLKR